MTINAAGRLYVVATPIGNLADVSARAIQTLTRVTLIAAEDTRHTGALLRHLGIRTPLISLHEHNEAARTPQILERLATGESVALVSDAGTPAISDPGFELVRAAAAAGIEVIAVPGPCAAIAALSIAGLPTDRFCFEGFLPARAAARRARLAALAHEPRTLVLYEAPHRVRALLEACVASLGGERRAVLARELTKLHESLYRGSLAELAQRAEREPELARGEIVLIVAGAAAGAEAGAAAGAKDSGAGGAHNGLLDRALKPLLKALPLRQAAELAAEIAEVRGNEAYRRALELKEAYGAG